MKQLIAILFILAATKVTGQKIDSIYFNLYTDSLKKGVHNYINVDGRSSAGIYQPLTSDEVVFTSTAGSWSGNSIILDSSFTGDKVTITACLKDQPSVRKSITVYLKKLPDPPLLMTESEVIESYKKQKRRQKN